MNWAILLTGLATLGWAFPVLAQPAPNIAGNYRGLLTGCLGTPAANVCRTELTDLVRLAVEVDLRRTEWERARAGREGALAPEQHADYLLAIDKLNQAVTAYNRSAAEAGQ